MPLGSADRYVKLRRCLKRILIASLLLPLFAGAFASTVHAWWDADWKSRITITFDNSAQTGGLADFPVLVVLNGSRIDYGKTQDQGEDIRFVDSDDTTILDYEIEKWDESGSSYVWVRVPQIPASSSTDYIYLYYDHGSESDAQNSTGVWSNGYAGVWHLAQDPSGGNPILDSTGNLKNGVGSSGMDSTNLVPARIGDGLSFDGSSDYVRVASNSTDSLAITGNFITLEAMVRRNGSTPGDVWMLPMGRQLGDDSTDSYILALHRLDPSQTLFVTTGGGNATGSTGQVPDLTWTYIAGVQNASNLTLYVNGSQDTQIASGGVIQTDANDVTFAGMENGTGSTITEWYVGELDEIRISNVERSPSWIAAQHLSMADSLNTYGAEDTDTCPTVSSTADTGPGSLRQCIAYANSNAGTAIIFDIPDTAPGYTTSGGNSWWRISPGSPLPAITAAGTVIDGTTQAANYGSQTNGTGPEIEVNGLSAGAGIDGLTFSATADSSQVRGLMVNRFTNDGIRTFNGANGITIADNWVGTDGSGLIDRGNGDDGIEVQGADSIIDSNVVVNNGDEGLQFTGGGATGNVITGNIIGLEPDGDSGSGNGDVGIALLTGAANTTIGGTDPADRNIISLNVEGIEVNTAGNVIRGNYIGTDITGTQPRGNDTDDGIELQGGANNNAIGGTAAGAGNLIAYNQLRGITVKAGTGNRILGNDIHSNNSMGIDLSDNGVTPNDGATGALPNIGMDYPVLTAAAVAGTVLHVEGYVGTAALKIAGTHIIELFKADDDGDSNGEIETGDGQNVGHGEGRWYIDRCTSAADGTFICDLTVPATVTLAVADSVTATATDAAGNTSEFGANVTVAPPGCPTVTSTADTGPGSLRDCIAYANSNAGTTILFDIPDTAPGYTTSSGNSWWRISPASALPAITADGTVIDGTTQAANYGSDTNSLGPEIEIDGSGAGAGANGLTVNVPGGTATIRHLVVDNFTLSGILLEGGSTTVTGSYLGLEPDGDTPAGNNTSSTAYHGGIRIVSSGNTIGGTAAFDRNVISGNTLAGVVMFGAAATGNQVLGNYIGTDAGGTLDRGNIADGEGIELQLANGNTIGGTAAGAGNVISGNASDGMEIDGSSNNTVQGNYIGTDYTGTVFIPNDRDGIDINSDLATGSTGNLIGGTGPGAGNLIAGNTLNGVELRDDTVVGATTNNSILGNLIYGNGQLGIDLEPAGVTANDAGDGDSGVNGLQNYPVITAVVSGGVSSTITGTLNSTPGTSFDLEFYSTSSPDPLGHGEAEAFLGTATVTTDGSGDASFTVNFPVGLAPGEYVTAIATNPAGSTSEFAANAVLPLYLVKQALLAADGSLITNSSTLPRGTVFRFLIYTENPGAARSDVSIRDVLDPAFAYSAGSLKVDNSVAVGASVQAIYAAVSGTAAMSDTIDADVASITGSTIDVGSGNVGNGQLDIAGNRVWSLLFTVRMQ